MKALVALKLPIAGAGTDWTGCGPATAVPAVSPAAFFTVSTKSGVVVPAGAAMVEPLLTALAGKPVPASVAEPEIVAVTVTGEPSVTMAGESENPLTEGAATTVSAAVWNTCAGVVAVFPMASVKVSVPGEATDAAVMVTLVSVPAEANLMLALLL